MIAPGMLVKAKRDILLWGSSTCHRDDGVVSFFRGDLALIVYYTTQHGECAVLTSSYRLGWWFTYEHSNDFEVICDA